MLRFCPLSIVDIFLKNSVFKAEEQFGLYSGTKLEKKLNFHLLWQVCQQADIRK